MKKTVKIFLILLILYSACFAAVEIILRISDPLGVEYFSEVVRYFDVLETRRNYSYIHPSGMDMEFQGVRIKTNSAGLRGPEIILRSDKDKKRILILGDSVVLGWGVEYDNTFPSLIAQMVIDNGLNAIVIPAGVSSWNTRTEYEFIKENIDLIDPDIIVLMTVSNDTDPKDNSNIEIGKKELQEFVYRPNTDQDIFRRTWFFFVDRSYVFKHLQFLVKMMTEKDQNNGASRDDLTWKDAELALERMRELCSEREISFIPYFYASQQVVSQHPIYSMYAEYYLENGIDYRTFPHKLFNGYEYTNSVIDNHPNPRGHRIIAKTIFSDIKKLLKDEHKENTE